MNLSELPIDLFMKQITYLPFDDVINICNTNKKLHDYCTNPDYNTRWKALINKTFSSIPNYNQKLEEVWLLLGYDKNKYNYIVYTKLIKTLDKITQAMIYYK